MGSHLPTKKGSHLATHLSTWAESIGIANGRWRLASILVLRNITESRSYCWLWMECRFSLPQRTRAAQTGQEERTPTCRTKRGVARSLLFVDNVGEG